MNLPDMRVRGVLFRRFLLPGVLMMAATVFSLSSGIGREVSAAVGAKNECKPTPSDSLGPFYKPGAPVRESVGKGYVLAGSVKAAADCSPLTGARIEFWLAGPDGKYDDDRRATVLAGENGEYRFESNYPPPYASRPSHIHIKVSAPGYRELVTQHYPVEGQQTAKYDLVLEVSE